MWGRRRLSTSPGAAGRSPSGRHAEPRFWTGSEPVKRHAPVISTSSAWLRWETSDPRKALSGTRSRPAGTSPCTLRVRMAGLHGSSADLRRARHDPTTSRDAVRLAHRGPVLAALISALPPTVDPPPTVAAATPTGSRSTWGPAGRFAAQPGSSLARPAPPVVGPTVETSRLGCTSPGHREQVEEVATPAEAAYPRRMVARRVGAGVRDCQRSACDVAKRRWGTGISTPSQALRSSAASALSRHGRDPALLLRGQQALRPSSRRG